MVAQPQMRLFIGTHDGRVEFLVEHTGEGARYVLPSRETAYEFAEAAAEDIFNGPTPTVFWQHVATLSGDPCVAFIDDELLEIGEVADAFDELLNTVLNAVLDAGIVPDGVEFREQWGDPPSYRNL